VRSRWLKMCAAMPLVVAVSAASGEPAPPTAGQHSQAVVTTNLKSSPKSGARSSGVGTPSAAVPAASQSVRMTIATFLEGQPRFRKFDDDGAPKLVNAKIAGPILGLRKSVPEQPFFCVQVNLILTNRILWVTQDELDAVITFIASEDGSVRIQGTVISVTTGSATCHDRPYTPFPELEQVRAQRRRALGKVDF
jgi:hypothetical protein